MVETNRTPAADASGQTASPVLPVTDVRRRILDGVAPIASTETVGIEACAGRVLAENVIAGARMPPFDSAAMDGYAFRHRADLPESLLIQGRSLPGKPLTEAVAEGHCARITTGAALPAGTDTVVPQEAVAVDGDRLVVRETPDAGAWVRAAGSDIAEGCELLAAGARLRAVDCGLLASQGRNMVIVYRRPRVAYFTTGDELRPPGQPLGPGQIHERHAYTLGPMVERLGGVFENRGIIPDDPGRIREALKQAATDADVVLTSGGVAHGDTDYLREAVADIGRLAAWRVALRPGRPLLTGALGEARYFGLPGNPVSATVAFALLVAPALLRLAGARTTEPHMYRALSAETFDKTPDHTWVLSGVMSRSGDGECRVGRAGPQGAAAFASLAAADCFIVLPHEAGSVRIGDPVDIMPFELLQ